MKVRLGDICTITGGYAFDSHKMTQKGDYQIIKMGNLYNGIFDLSRNSSFINAPTKKELEYLIQENDILITLTGTTNKKDYGYTVQMEQPKNLLLNQRCALIRASKVNEKYLFYLLNSNDFLKQFYASSTGGTGNQTNVSINDMLDFKVYISNENDQSKISNILNALDKKILTQIKIIELKQSLIKDIEDRILWKTANAQTKPIREFLTEINDKSIIQNQYPLLSSTKKGLFLQTDYFNKEAASSNNIGYKIVHKGDIIISPQNLWMGNITYNDKFDNGLVSPSYRIYKVKEEYNAFYISRIMMSYRALSLYKNISEQGASIVRRNLNVDAFNELCFPIPNIKKQDEVGLFLSKLHQELKCETWILMQLKNQKNYLLNKMFI
jgi:restriction endonuclease S subunit